MAFMIIYKDLRMSYLFKVLFRMGLLIGLVITSVVYMFAPLVHIFSHNLWLNGVIFTVIGFGIFWGFYLIFMLSQEQKWLDRFDVGRERFPGAPKVKILMPLAILINEEQLPQNLNPLAAKSILSSIESRLDETRDTSRYIVGLLVFLGLLGTFWGLSETVGGIAGVIGGIDMHGQDVKEAFQTLKQGLNAPLAGMGTAFSCSMFGLAGSLIIGFLDLQVGRAFTTFYQRIEERLAFSVRFGGGASLDVNGAGPAFSAGLLEQTVEGLSSLYNQLKRSEETRLSMAKSLQVFSEKLSEMSEHMIAHQSFSQRLAQNQIELQESLMNQSKDGLHGRNEEIVKTHIRSIDATLTKMLEEFIEGNNRSTNDIRQEIRVVARTLSAIANGQEVAA